MTDKIYRITFDLLEDDFKTLESLATDNNLTKSDVIRHGVAYYNFIANTIKEGGSLLVEDKCGNLNKVIIKDS